jgi:hypothetical protein
MGDREYDPSLGRWLSADTIVPDPANPQSLNRFSYVYNNPLKYVDPTGHLTEEEIMSMVNAETWEDVLAYFREGGSLEGRWGWLETLRQAQIGDRVVFSDLADGSAWFGFDSGPIGGQLIKNDSGQIGIEIWSHWFGVHAGLIGDHYAVEVYHSGFEDPFAMPPHSSSIFGGGWFQVFETDAGTKYSHLRYDWSRVDKAAILRDVGGIELGLLEFSPVPLVPECAYGMGLAVDVHSIEEGVLELSAKGWPAFSEAPLDYLGMSADAAGLIPWFGIGGDVAGIGFSLFGGFHYSP